MRITRLLLAMLWLATASTACTRQPAYQPLPAGTMVLAFGDSITYGTGAAAGEDYPGKLAVATGWTVVNGGVPGDTTESARGRLGALLAQHQPKLVIVELGGNDFLHGADDAQVAANLEAMLNEIGTAGATPVLVEVPRPSLAAVIGKGGGAPLYRKLADDRRILLIEAVLPDILASNSLKSDAIHPNASGYAKLAEGLADACRTAGLLREAH